MMPPLTAREALDHQVVRVTTMMRSANLEGQAGRARAYAVFDDEEGVRFLGLVTAAVCADFPFRIFADLVRKPQPAPVLAESSIEVVCQRMEVESVEALPVLGEQEAFLGAITRLSLLEALVRRERQLLAEAQRVQGSLEAEQAQGRLLEQIRMGRERLRILCQQLVKVQETERRHLARELHDEIGQDLTGIKLTLEMAARSCTDAAQPSLREAKALVDNLIARVRDLSLDLRPPMLDDLGLLPALRWYVERYTTQTGVRVIFEQHGLEGRFAPDIETAAYRIVQEALTNVARHAGVHEATMCLWSSQGRIGVQIQDLGTGFSPEAALPASTTGGLTGMRERAELVGGYLKVESVPGAGTRVTAELPLSSSVDRRKQDRGA